MEVMEELYIKYQIEIREELARIIEIEAIDEDEAVSKVLEDYRNEKIVLTADDFMGTEISPYRDYEK